MPKCHIESSTFQPKFKTPSPVLLTRTFRCAVPMPVPVPTHARVRVHVCASICLCTGMYSTVQLCTMHVLVPVCCADIDMDVYWDNGTRTLKLT
jgi:hypothetical protein